MTITILCPFGFVHFPSPFVWLMYAFHRQPIGTAPMRLIRLRMHCTLWKVTFKRNVMSKFNFQFNINQFMLLVMIFCLGRFFSAHLTATAFNRLQWQETGRAFTSFKMFIASWVHLRFFARVFRAVCSKPAHTLWIIEKWFCIFSSHNKFILKIYGSNGQECHRRQIKFCVSRRQHFKLQEILFRSSIHAYVYRT